MAKRTININPLSAKSYKDAAKQVERLKRTYLEKNKEFIRELCKEGITEARNHLVGYGDSDPPDFYTDSPYVTRGNIDGNMSATLRLQGEDVAFVEFGAGIHYNNHPNSSPNPYGVKLGYTIGSYGWHHGLEDHWWYEDENGVTVISYGTEATMPLYHASEKIKQRYKEIAKTVFGS